MAVEERLVRALERIADALEQQSPRTNLCARSSQKRAAPDVGERRLRDDYHPIAILDTKRHGDLDDEEWELLTLCVHSDWELAQLTRTDERTVREYLDKFQIEPWYRRKEHSSAQTAK